MAKFRISIRFWKIYFPFFLVTAGIVGISMVHISDNLVKTAGAKYDAEIERCIVNGTPDINGLVPEIYICRGESETVFRARIENELTAVDLETRPYFGAGFWITVGAGVIAILYVLILGLRKFFSRTIAVSIVQGENRKVSNVESHQDGESKNVQELLRQIDNLLAEGIISESEHATARLKVITE